MNTYLELATAINKMAGPYRGGGKGLLELPTRGDRGFIMEKVEEFSRILENRIIKYKEMENQIQSFEESFEEFAKNNMWYPGATEEWTWVTVQVQSKEEVVYIHLQHGGSSWVETDGTFMTAAYSIFCWLPNRLANDPTSSQAIAHRVGKVTGEYGEQLTSDQAEEFPSVDLKIKDSYEESLVSRRQDIARQAKDCKALNDLKKFFDAEHSNLLVLAEVEHKRCKAEQAALMKAAKERDEATQAKGAKVAQLRRAKKPIPRTL
jgi:hypothetical protein